MNVKSDDGLHDVFGAANPDVNRVSASFGDGSAINADVHAGAFALVWVGKRSLDKLTAFAGDRPVGRCVPPGAPTAMSIEVNGRKELFFTCGNV